MFSKDSHHQLLDATNKSGEKTETKVSALAPLTESEKKELKQRIVVAIAACNALNNNVH
jgi:hypothetical protein